MGAAKHNGTYGEVLFSNSSSGTYGDNDEFSFDHSWVHRAYFDANGYVVDSSVSTAFADPDGELHIADADVPKELGATFEAGTIDASDWDCVGEDTITVDMTGANGAAHDACESGRWDYIDCYTGYEESTEEHDIDESAQKEDSEFEEIEVTE